MEKSGITFYPGVTIGDDGTPLDELRREYDAVLLAIGSTIPRTIDVPGAELEGVHAAMTYLEASNRAVRDDVATPISAQGKHVVILGGGDTGADCLGTVHRQGATSIVQIEILDRPPDARPAGEPWPTMARLFKTTSAHQEGGERVFSTETLEFRGDGRLEAIVLRDMTSGELVTTPVDLVLIAAGFIGPELARLGLDAEQYLTERNTLAVGDDWSLGAQPGMSTLFACGDAVRGQSLIVWAIAEGRSAASAIDARLRARASTLPAPVAPYEISW
jgi:glutamate synthase (NADPH/NADH) small chain